MNCEEVAGLSGQTGEIKRSRSKVWLLRLLLGHCRLSNLISCRKRPTSSISGNSFIEFSHWLFSHFSHSSLRLLLSSTFALHVSTWKWTECKFIPGWGFVSFPSSQMKHGANRAHQAVTSVLSVNVVTVAFRTKELNFSLYIEK